MAAGTDARRHFHDELARLEQQALGGLDLALEQLDRVLDALTHQDVELAGMVVVEDDRLDGRYLEVHRGILSLLARQAPVAGDLRLVAALLHVIKHAERMGDQCVNIAKLIPLAGHEPPVSEDLLEMVLRMGALAREEVALCRGAFAARDVEQAEALAAYDRHTNGLQREIFRRAITVGEDADRREWAMHMVLAARAIERIGDHAVDVGEQTAFLVTGLFREFDRHTTAADSGSVRAGL